MATSSNHLAAPSSSSSSATRWDVFLSFYGKDTRKNFTSHLYSALVRAGILTFMDDPELDKGEEISHGLLNAIHGSKLLIVVLSENYAYSRWCLDELVEILTCKRTSGHVVIPVFYYIDPSHLRHLKGSFKDALDVHKKRYSVDVIEKWRSALAEIAELSGYHLKTDANENESDTVEEIVENVTPLIYTKDLQLGEYLVGIDSSVEEIYKKLSMESNDVRAIGICGMGGIGKTTTAKAFYNKYFDIFDISCFVDDLKQHSQGGNSLLPFLQQLSVKLFGRTYYKVPDVKSGIRQLKQFLCNKKALIVVDDLDKSSYSELLRVCNLFSDGSRIIFTTRDANLANQLKEDVSGVDIYMMREMEQVDSLHLFSYHAFRKPTAPECFKELSISFIEYAGGLPLALKVLGSSLLGRTDVSFWNDKLAKVREIGENDIQKILQLSYDELDDKTQKAIFLDIAFFFVGRNKDEAVHVFRSCGFFPDVGIPILQERCLLTVDENNSFQMHDLIRLMGKEVESKHGNCRRLYLHQGNTCAALQNLEGTEFIEGLVIDQTMSAKRHLSAKIFERLPNLRLLEIIGACDIEGSFDNSLCELRCFRWHHCSWTHFPSGFRPQKLVFLDTPYSEFKTLWKGTKPLVNLKTINLSNSRKLKIMPDFSNIKLVEKLLFRGCISLEQVHPSIGRLTYLSHLDLGECSQLKELTAPIAQLTKLGHLDLGGCVNLKRLPELIIQLTTLGSLNLRFCHNLTQLPELIIQLTTLGSLHLRSCENLTSLPNSLWKLKVLRVLDVNWSSKLEQLPEQLGKMQCLELLYASCTAIEELPESIGLLSRLEVLDLQGCNKVRNHPSSIWNLTSLASLSLRLEDKDKITIPDMVKDMKLKRLVLRCNPSIWLPLILSFSSLEKLTLYDARQSFSPNESYSLYKLSNLQDLHLYNFSSLGCCFPELPLNLRNLSIYSYATLKMLPDLSSLKQLKSLHVSRCISLQLFPALPPHLERLSVRGCTGLQDLPDLSMLKEFKNLDFSDCINLNPISLKQSFLQVGQNKYNSFKADIPNREVAEWFDYKSSGNTLSFTIPPNSGNKLSGFGLLIWIVYKFKYAHGNCIPWKTAVIKNRTKDTNTNHEFDLEWYAVGGEVQSHLRNMDCIGMDCMDCEGILLRME